MQKTLQLEFLDLNKTKILWKQLYQFSSLHSFFLEICLLDFSAFWHLKGCNCSKLRKRAQNTPQNLVFIFCVIISLYFIIKIFFLILIFLSNEPKWNFLWYTTLLHKASAWQKSLFSRYDPKLSHQIGLQDSFISNIFKLVS